MSATTAALAGRRAAERLMVDSCTITRPGTGVAKAFSIRTTI